MSAAIHLHLPNAPVFPCSPDKKPLVKWKEPWHGDIADGEAYGIPTGARSGAFVLDLDRKRADADGLKSISDFANGRELPDTLTVKTQSAGLHLYFNNVEGLTNRAGVLPGVDVRAEGGYVLGPNSPGYTVIHPGPIADAPEWLIDLIKKPAPVESFPAIAIDEMDPEFPRRVEMAKKYLAVAEPCIAGQGGDNRLWLVCVHLTRRLQLPLAEAFKLIQPYNERCEPPWETDVVFRKLTEAQAKGQSPTGTVEFTDSVIAPIDPTKIKPQVKNPAHKYSFRVSTDLSGASMQKLMQPDVTSCLIGSEHWSGVWQYDVFRRRIIAVNPPLKLRAENEGYCAADNANIGLWFAAQGYDVSDTQIDKAIESAASELEIHPVRQYLDQLSKPSLETARAYFTSIAARLWGATERDEIESGHLMRFAIAAVRRVRRPGTKVDTTLILVGGQGLNKSRFGLHLFGEFFSDNMPKLTSKDAMLALDGVWGLEMAELKSMHGVTEDERKAFLSRQIDKYRPPYGKGDIVVPRQVVFYGSTNSTDFLTDSTGERRYDIVEIDQAIDLSFSRDEFWGAAAVLEAHGESHFRSAEDPREKSAAEEKMRYRHQDAWEPAVIEYLTKHPEEWIRAATVLAEAIVIPLERRDDRAMKRVQAVLRRLLGPSVARRFGDVTYRAYWSPATSAPST